MQTETSFDLPKNCLFELHTNQVVSFSSQYGKENSLIYTATNLAKPPHYCKYPAYGDFEVCYLLVRFFFIFKTINNKVTYFFSSTLKIEVNYVKKY